MVESAEPKEFTAKYKKLQGQLQENIGSIGFMMYLVPQLQKDGAVILQHTSTLTEKLVILAQGNEGVYNVLTKLCSTSAWSAVIVECVAITNAIMANHNVKLPNPFDKKKVEEPQNAELELPVFSVSP